MAATSRSMTVQTPTLTSPNWQGDFMGREQILPAGGKLDNTAFGAADSSGKIPIPSGTVVGRTIAERDAGSPFGPCADTDVDVYLLANDVTDALVNDDCELASPFSGVRVKENFLPGWAGLSAAVKALVRARYVCYNGIS